MIFKKKRKGLFRDTRAFLLRDVAIAAVFGFGILALYVLFVGAMADNYNRQDIVSPAFSQNYDKLTSMTANLEQSRQAVTNSTSGLSFIGTFQITFNALFTVIQMVWGAVDSFGIASSNALSDFMIIPSTVFTLLFTILLAALTIYIIYVIISSVTRGRV